MKKQFAFAAMLGLACAFSSLSASAADLLDTIMQQKVVRIAVPQDYAPMALWGVICNRRALISTPPG